MNLVVIGLLVSKPIVVLGSQVVLKLVERFPVIIHLGAAVLAFTAAKMVVSEPWLAPVFNPPDLINSVARWAVYGIAITGAMVAGLWASKRIRPASLASE